VNGAHALVCGLASALLVHSDATASGRVVRVEKPNLEAIPAHGPREAPVVIEVFVAPTYYQQPRKHKGVQAVEALQAQHPNGIRLEYRFVNGSDKSRLHYAALQAHSEGKFDEFMDAIGSKASAQTDAQLIELADAIGLDPRRMAAVLSNPPIAFDRAIAANVRRLRQKSKLAISPFILMNGHPLRQVPSSPSDLKQEYDAALEQAAELVDRGVPPLLLPQAFDAQAAPDPLHIVVPTGLSDSPTDERAQPPRLAAPALSWEGMPTLGPPDAAVTVAVLCSPASVTCGPVMRAARAAQEAFADSVQLVWAPYFDLNQEYTASLAALAETLLCSEGLPTGSGGVANLASSRWRRIEALLHELNRRPWMTTTEITDRWVAEMSVDPESLASCISQRAGSAIAWVKRAHQAGVQESPSTVVGGRIYAGIGDPRALLQLIDAELHPGSCDGCLHLAEYAPTWYR